MKHITFILLILLSTQVCGQLVDIGTDCNCLAISFTNFYQLKSQSQVIDSLNKLATYSQGTTRLDISNHQGSTIESTAYKYIQHWSIDTLDLIPSNWSKSFLKKVFALQNIEVFRFFIVNEDDHLFDDDMKTSFFDKKLMFNGLSIKQAMKLDHFKSYTSLTLSELLPEKGFGNSFKIIAGWQIYEIMKAIDNNDRLIEFNLINSRIQDNAGNAVFAHLPSSVIKLRLEGDKNKQYVILSKSDFEKLTLKSFELINIDLQ